MTTRKERIVLEMESNIASTALRDAAAVKLLNEQVHSLSRGAVESRRASREIAAGHDDVTRSTQRAEASIDRYSGRLSMLAQTAAALGPGLVPIAAVGVPAITTLASSLGFATLGVGVMVGAFHGLGTALDAVNKAQLQPTAANLQAARVAMQQLSPEARGMVTELRSFIPALKELRDTADAQMFPGLTDGLNQLHKAMPAVEGIVSAVSRELGHLASDAGADLTSGRWADFFAFLEREAPKALDDMARGAGNVAHAGAELWMAFGPLNSGFSTGLLHDTAALDKWATGLSKTVGFQEFIAYIEANGPQVGRTLGSIANAALQIVEAAAPIGGPVLHGLQAFADVVAAIANSDMGTPIMAGVAALSAFRLASSAASKTVGMTQEYAWGRTAKTNVLGFGRALTTVTSAQDRARLSSAGLAKVEQERHAAMRAGLITMGKGAAVVTGLALASSGAANKIGLTNTASLAFMGIMGGPWGAAIGGAVGGVMDLYHASDGLNGSLAQLDAMAGKVDFSTFNQQLSETQKQIDDLKHTTGLGDLIGDTLKGASATLHGRGLTKGQITQSYQKDANAAETSQDAVLRQRGAAVANQQAYEAAVLASRGYKLTAEGAREASMSVDAFRASLDQLSAGLGRQAALDAYRSSLLDLRDALQQNGKTLNEHTRAGLANRAALRQMASSATEAAKAMNPDHAKKFLQGAREGLIKAAVSFGATRAEARQLANTLGLVDRIHAQPKVDEKGAKESRSRVQQLRAEIQALKGKLIHTDENGSAAIRARIRALQAEINGLHGKTIEVHVNVSRSGANMGGGAGTMGASTGAYGMLWHGGVRHYAYGDVANRHQPELAGPGATRVWREPETLGEAYIPLANDDRRPRARSIAAETVDLLGGEVLWYADGGRRGGHPHRGGSGHGGGGTRLKEFNAELAKATAALERERTVRDDIVQKRQELASSVTAGLTHDIFGQKSSTFAWMSAGDRNKQLTGDTMTTLRGDTATGKKFKSLVANLKSRGVDGQALAEIIGRGDIDLAQAMASMSTSDLRSYKSLYNERANVLNSVGAAAGTAAYGGPQAIANRHLATIAAEQQHLRAEIAHLRHELHGHPKKTGQEVGKHINHAASNASRRSH